ncbi:MAG: ABC transporter ATP-binding protein [Rhodocyclaceae bacterium]|nr:ABC transporter ATP-binding protein [Rhodocyclaceae bacterium]
MPHLRIDRITQSYQDHTVVRDLSLTVARGEIACLLGTSGCGKTTVLRCIAGFEQIRQGGIWIGGKEVSGVPPEQRCVGMVFQDYALFPHLNIASNIAFGLRGRSAAERQRRVEELLASVGLAGHGDKYPHQLSGGQQQRVALARALAPSPQLLLLDEPFSNLDVELRERLSLEVRAILKEAGITAIMVTHDQNEAFAVADVVGVMRDGRIEQWDTPYNLYHRPATRSVAEFVGHGVFIPADVVARDTVRLEIGVLHSQLPLECAASCVECGKGCRIEVLLRPDDVIHEDASPIQATVVAKAFRGANFLYTLRLPSGREVLSLVPSHHNHALGEPIGIRLDVDHVVAFGPVAAQ